MGRPHSIRFFMKRARVCQLTFGDSAHRRDRCTTLNGFWPTMMLGS